MFASSTGLRQLSLNVKSAGHVLGKIRKLEQSWVCLIETNSDLAALCEAYRLGPLTEFLRIDELLARVLARLLIEGGQNVDRGPQPAFNALSRESAGSVRVDVAADSNMGTEGAGSNWGAGVVAEIQASAKESGPVSVRQKPPISRAQASDYFNKVAEQAGVRSVWGSSLVMNSRSTKTLNPILARAPSPGLRRFWIEASTASKVMDQLRTLEQECASLFGSSADQPIFHQEDLMRPLVEFLGIDQTLAGALARRAREDNQDPSRLPKPDAPSPQLAEGPPIVRKASSPAPVPPLRVEKDPAPEARTRLVHRPSTLTGTPREVAPQMERGPAPLADNISITRAQARTHFNEIAGAAGLNSAWNERATTTLGIGPTLETPALANQATGLVKPHMLDSKRAIDGASVDHQHTFPSVFPPTVTRPAGSVWSAGVSNPVANQNPPQMIQSEPATDVEHRNGERWDQVLRPVVETIYSSRRMDRARRASKEPRVASHANAEKEDSDTLSEVPLTGLRLLAQMAVTTADPKKSDIQTIFGDRSMTYGAPRPAMAQVASGVETDFASHIAEYLRSEIRRHGISLENN